MDDCECSVGMITTTISAIMVGDGETVFDFCEDVLWFVPRLSSALLAASHSIRYIRQMNG